jgi:hypothetical protein
LSLVLRFDKKPPLAVLEEPPLLPVGEEVAVVGEPVPCAVILAVDPVVAWDTLAEPVATPAMIEAVILDVLVG